MEISPFEFIAAFAAACLVLLIARIKGGRKVPRRFSLSTLLIAMSLAAIVLGLIGYALRV
jgi:ABC-type Fe3+-siderophore transport system permease subunit